MSERSMVKLLLADGFFADGEAQALSDVIGALRFTPTQYGDEVENFTMVSSDAADKMSVVIGERVEVTPVVSGVFRRPRIGTVRFESFHGLNEWCFAVALEPTTFNMYKHLASGVGELGVVDAHSALDICNLPYQINYANYFEWDLDVNIRMQPNQGVFYRPWMFHSFEDGLIQRFHLKAV